MRIEHIGERKYIKSESIYTLSVSHVQLMATYRKGYMYSVRSGGSMSNGNIEATEKIAIEKGLVELRRQVEKLERKMLRYSK